MPALLAALRTLGTAGLERLAVSLEGLGATAVGRSATAIYAAIRGLVMRNPKTAKFIAEALTLVGLQVAVDDLLGDDESDEAARKDGHPVAALTVPARQRILQAMRDYGVTLGQAIAKHSGDGDPNTIDGQPAAAVYENGIQVIAKVRLLQEARRNTGMTWRELEYLRLLLSAEPQWFSLAMSAEEL